MGLHQRTSSQLERIIASLSYHLFIFLMRIAWQSTIHWVTMLPKEDLCFGSDWIWICSLLLSDVILTTEWKMVPVPINSKITYTTPFFHKLNDRVRCRLLPCCCGLFVFISHPRALGSVSLLSIPAAVQKQSYCTIQYLNNCLRWLLKSTAVP